jgi:hypothetical protein
MEPGIVRALIAYERGGDEFEVGHWPLQGIDLPELQAMFGVPAEDQMFDHWDVEPEHVERLRQAAGVDIDLARYSYSITSYRDPDAPVAMLRGDGFAAVFSAWGYERPDAADADDGNWVSGEFELSLHTPGYFRALVKLSWRAEQLRRFYDELVQLDKTLNGKAHLAHMEGMVELSVRLDHGRGSFTGYVAEPGASRLEFEGIPTDQSFLAEALAGFKRIVERFPAYEERNSPPAASS